MSRPANPPEVHIPPRHGKSALTGMFGDPDSWDALHNDVDGAAVSVPDDPATLRARLEERYERPERPCTYDPADEEPEAEPVAIHNPDPGYFGVTEWSGGTDPSIVGMAYRNAVEEGPPPVPALGYVLGARLENIDSSIVPPDGTIMDLDGHRVVARNGEWHGHHLGVLGYSELHPDRVVVFVPDTDPLRSYLRTLTNPDATPEDVAAALDLLTDEDRELVAALTKRNP